MKQTPQTPTPQDADPRVMYQKMVMAARKIIFDPKASKGLVEIMQKLASDPAAGVAQATMTVLGGMKEKMKGGKPNMVNAVAPVVVAELFALGSAAGIFKATPQLVQQAVALVKQELAKKPAQPAQQPPAEPAAQPAPKGLIGNAMGAPA